MNLSISFYNANEFKKESDVKPCPFCGGSEICTYQYQHEAGLRYAIICMECMASIDPGYAQERWTVLDMWNKRHFIFQKRRRARWK